MAPGRMPVDIGKSFRLEDVTDNPEKLRIAFDIVAQAYSALSTTPIDPRSVLATVCEDIYHRNGLAHTLLLTGLYPGTSKRNPLGTVRILPSGNTGMGVPPLEAMSLMAPKEGWQHFRFLDFDLDQVMEGGRIVVDPVCRTEAAKQLGLTGLALRALTQGGIRIAAQRYGKSQCWGIVPNYMITRMEAAGLQAIPAPQVSCRFEENADLFRTYDRYWLCSNPRFCRIAVLPADDILDESGLVAALSDPENQS
jgi:hypothetical protein